MNTFVAILNKVKNSSDFISLMTITYGRNAFGIVGKKAELDRITKNKPFDNCVSIRCAYEQYKYTSFDNISKNPDLAKKWKVLTSKGNGGAGILNFDKAVAILGKAFVSPPYEVCTDSLIPIGSFDTEQEAVNLQKYMSTKFLRFMVGIMKTSQNIYQVVYRFVPLLDFTDKSDIDWTQSIADIDNQLYKKYHLSEDEVSLIDRMIKTMDQE